MKIAIFFIAAVTAYLVGSVNPAIILSQAVYRVDVRLFGSHNPGFTNFKRIFGNDHAWTVFLIDSLKSAVMCALFGWAFLHFWGMYHFGAAFTSFFTLLGHAFPIWYNFQGGKGVAVMYAAIWFIEWRAGVVITVVFLALMILTRYMSLSVIIAALTAPFTMLIVGTEHPAVWYITTVSILFMVLRHWENIKRLIHGTESKFSLRSGGRRKDGEGEQ